LEDMINAMVWCDGLGREKTGRLKFRRVKSSRRGVLQKVAPAFSCDSPFLSFAYPRNCLSICFLNLLFLSRLPFDLHITQRWLQKNMASLLSL
jgi:hypothetical protein